MEYRLSKLKDITTYIARGITPKYTEDLSGLCVINQKCIRDYKLLLENARRHDISKKQITDEKIVQKYDILINSTGVGTAGRVAQNFENQIITADSHVTIVRPDSNKINPIYLGYAVKNQQKYIEGLAEGSTGQTEISRQRIGEEILIKFPINKQVQRRISGFLLNIDKKIDLNNKINDNLHKLLKNTYKYLFIDNKNEDWKSDRLGNYLTVERGLSYKGKFLADDGIPMINLGNVMPDGVFRLEKNKYYTGEYKEKVTASPGDIVVANTDMTQNREVIGTPIIIPTLYNDKVIFSHHIYGLKNLKLPKMYVFYSLLTDEWNGIAGGSATGTTVLALPKDAIEEYIITIPDELTLNRFENLAENIQNKREQIIIENIELEQLRDTLLQKLMNGEIDLDKIEI